MSSKASAASTATAPTTTSPPTHQATASTSPSCRTPTPPVTEKQLAQREKFATKQAACTAWLNANRPGEKNGEKGTAAYQMVQKMKRAYVFSNINQVLYKYMDDKGSIKLPDGTGNTTSGGGTSSGGSSNPDSGLEG